MRRGRLRTLWTLIATLALSAAIQAGSPVASQEEQPELTPAIFTIEKTADPEQTFRQGETIAYTIVITNGTPSDAPNVVVTEGFDPDELTPTNPTVIGPADRLDPSVERSTITWQLGTLRAGQVVTLTYRGTPTEQAMSRLEVTTRTTLNVDGRNYKPKDVTLRPLLTLKSSPQLSGPRLENTITWVANADVPGLQIIEQVSAEEEQLSSSALAAAVSFEFDDSRPASVTNTRLAWDVGNVRAGQQGRIGYSATISDSLNNGMLRLVATSTAESDLGTVRVVTDTFSLPLPRLIMAKAEAVGPGGDNVVEPGKKMRIWLTVLNDGAPASGVVVTLDRDPREEENADVSATGFYSDALVTWEIDSIDRREVLWYQFDASKQISREDANDRVLEVRVDGQVIDQATEAVSYVIKPRSTTLQRGSKLMIFLALLGLLVRAQPRLNRTPSRRRTDKTPGADRLDHPVHTTHKLADHNAGLALSGGGYRAAGFGLGVLLYLVDSNHHQKFGHVSSVSGGSITNAFVARTTHFSCSGQHRDAFWEQVAPLGRQLANRSLTGFGWRIPVIVVAWGVVVLVGAILGVFATTMRGVIASGAAGVTLLYLAYRALGLEVYARLGKLFGGAPVADLRTGDAAHVLCATDLVWGKHFYFSRNIVYHEKYERGEYEVFPLARAVQASAAFPGAFPAVPIRAKKDFQMTAKDKPNTVRLVDGGVHDNLGVTWFTQVDFASVPALADLRRPTPHVVVNASSESVNKQPLRNVALIADVWSFFRSMVIIHQSNSAARAADLHRQHFGTARPSAVAISIDDNPYEDVRRELFGEDKETGGPAPGRVPHPDDDEEGAEHNTLDPERRTRLQVLWDGLQAAKRDGWTAARWAKTGEVGSPGVRTNLLFLSDAPSLVYHGYVAAMVETYLSLGWDPPTEEFEPSDGGRRRRAVIPQFDKFTALCPQDGLPWWAWWRRLRRRGS